MKKEKISIKKYFKAAGVAGITVLTGTLLFSISDLEINKGKEVISESEKTEETHSEWMENSASGSIEEEENPLLILVNAEHPLPEEWEGEQVEIINHQSIDKRAYDDLQEMLEDAREEGFSPYICSSYRSHETQVRLFEEEVRKYQNQGYSEEEATKKAGEWVAVPGTSEHELGLAIDIVSLENQNLDESQLNTGFQKWLMEHCYDYGFILRYPTDKADITGIQFEPWHYRYVGREPAMEMKEKNLCLEEYLAQKK